MIKLTRTSLLSMLVEDLSMYTGLAFKFIPVIIKIINNKSLKREMYSRDLEDDKCMDEYADITLNEIIDFLALFSRKSLDGISIVID